MQWFKSLFDYWLPKQPGRKIHHVKRSQSGVEDLLKKPENGTSPP